MLENGSWDGWNFAKGMMPSEWKSFVAAPLPIPADAKTVFVNEGLRYELKSYSAKTVKLTAPETGVYTGEVTVPSTFVDEGVTYTVVEVDKNAFANSTVTTVSLPATVTAIGKEAFKNSTIATLNVPSVDGVTKIGDGVFSGCSNFATLFVPSSMTSIPDSMFEGTAIADIKFPAQVEAVGKRAFAACQQLAGVEIPATITAIGEEAFAESNAITSVKVASTYPVAIADNVFSAGAYANATLEVPNGYTADYAAAAGWKNFTKVSEYVLDVKVGDIFKVGGMTYAVTAVGESNNVKATYCKVEGTPDRKKIEAANKAGYVGEITIPASVTFQNVDFNVTEMSDSTFYGASELTLARIIAPVVSLGDYAFFDCTKLESVDLPSTLKRLGTYAFAYCKSMPSVTLPDGLTDFGEARTFAWCSKLSEINFPEGVTALPEYCFYGTGFPGIRLPSTLRTVGRNLFQSCPSLRKVIIEDGLTEISDYMFSSCSSLVAVKMPDTATKIGNYVFQNCTSLRMPVLPAGLTEVPNYMFSKCSSMESIELPETVTSIGNYAFENCSSLEFSLPAGVTNLGKGAFKNCKLIKEFTMPAAMTETTVGDDATFTVTVPDTDDTDMLRLIVQYEENGSTYTAGYPEMIEVEKTFAFSDAEYDAHFDESFTPTLVFYKDAYSLDKIEFSSSNTEVASVNKRTGAVSVKRVEGDAVITAALKTDPAVNATMTVHAALRIPVTGFVLGNGDKTINLTYLDILALSPTVEPANADIQTYDISVSDPEVATTYAAKAFNPLRSFWELITHKTGTVDVTFTSQDGSGASTTYTVNVLEPNREPLADSYQNGTFWLNEDWFGHSNGSINYIADNGEMKYHVYESQNKYESFGCTSQYGIIYGDKLIVMSKQATDGGDPRKGGGRVVVADAKTLKKLAAFDYIGADTDGDGNGNGDGRACVGVSEDKVYLGSTAGIQVLDTRKLTLGGMVDGITSGENQYNGQIGDMVAIGKYAFAIQQGVGVHVIDIATDKVVKTFPVESDDASGVSGMGYPQGITVTADGNVWVATTADASKGLCTFRCIDPNTLDVTDSVELPEGQRVTCGWGAWRSTNFFASKSENAIWYGAGVEASIVSGNTGYYKWTVGSDIAGIKPVFVFPNNLEGVDSKTFQAPYACVRYDDRKDQLLVAATHGASSNYRYNWLHFVDCKTGDIVNTLKMKDYYWFPSMPIFPDKYAPEFAELPDVSVDLAKAGDVFTINLKDYVTDKDNIDAAIRLSIVGGDAVAADNTVSDKSLVNATLENGVLTITPLIAGHGNLNVKAESNGKTTTVSIPYAVEDSASGIHNVDGAAGTLSVCDNIVTVKNMAGTTFAVYDMAGRVVGAFVADSDCARVALTLPSGVYVVAATSGSHTLKFSIQ